MLAIENSTIIITIITITFFNFDSGWTNESRMTMKRNNASINVTLSLDFGKGSVKVRLKRIKSDHLIRTPVNRLYPCFRAFDSNQLSFCFHKNFFGSHPRKAHVPPNGSESIIATLHPADLHSDAVVGLQYSVPITIKSNFCIPLYSG